MKRPLILAVSSALLLASCGDSGEGGGGSPSGSPEAVELTISAASSLTAAFTDMGAAFEDAAPG